MYVCIICIYILCIESQLLKFWAAPHIKSCNWMSKLTKNLATVKGFWRHNQKLTQDKRHDRPEMSLVVIVILHLTTSRHSWFWTYDMCTLQCADCHGMQHQWALPAETAAQQWDLVTSHSVLSACAQLSVLVESHSLTVGKKKSSYSPITISQQVSIQLV